MLLVLFSQLAITSFACTNILVSRSASIDGNAMIGANDDSGKRDGGVTRFPAADWPKGATRSIYDFESSVYAGEILQPDRTLNVMTYVNDFGVVIAESTMGGIAELHG